jgi:hypothetical protein
MPKRGAEIRHIDKSDHKARNPEGVVMSEQRQQTQNGDNLDLHFLSSVGDPLGQRVQAQKQDTDAENGADDHQSGHGEQDVRLAGRGDKARHMTGCIRM